MGNRTISVLNGQKSCTGIILSVIQSFAFPKSCNIIKRIFMVMIKSMRILKSPSRDLWKDQVVMLRMFIDVSRRLLKGSSADLL